MRRHRVSRNNNRRALSAAGLNSTAKVTSRVDLPVGTHSFQ